MYAHASRLKFLYNPLMLIGEKLRALRVSKNLSQGDIEKRTGLIRCYTSRVENGHTVPSVETLEKYARALGIPLYRLFYENEKPARDALPASALRHSSDKIEGFVPFARAVQSLNDQDRHLLLVLANQMAKNRERRGRAKKTKVK
jgi:transcriptional regulator with XRE-family HTH domain